MPAGQKTLVVNTLERAVSSDINRLQSFAAAAASELQRALVNTSCGLDDIEASSLNVQNTGTAAPESLDVFNGLVVRPINGTLTCSIDAGVAGVIFPDSDPDSSPYKQVSDPGVASGAALVIPPNSSGSIRIDIIECLFVLNANSETDNRDIFNPATGAFVATTVPKASQGTFQYQLRSGTGGSGFPGTLTGWTPLCVISVPSGAASVSDCTFWDVRPLVEDRVFAPANLSSVVPRTFRNVVAIDTLSTSGKALLAGNVDTTATDTHVLTGGPAGLYRLGGTFPSGIDLNSAANQSGTISNGPAYVYLIEPFGLPRWAQYRVLIGGALSPSNPRGIPVLSSVEPVAFFLCPLSALALPTATGLGGTCTKAVCIGVTKFAGGVCSGMQTDGATQTCGDSPWPLQTVGGSQFTLTSGTHYPATATALWITIVFQGSVANGQNGLLGGTIDVCDVTGVTVLSKFVAPVFTFPNGTGSSQVLQTGFRVKVAVPPASPTAFLLRWTLTISNVTEIDCQAQVDGWDV